MMPWLLMLKLKRCFRHQHQQQPTTTTTTTAVAEKKGEEATKAYVSFTSNREKIIVGIFAKAMTYNGKQAACTCTNA